MRLPTHIAPGLAALGLFFSACSGGEKEQASMAPVIEQVHVPQRQVQPDAIQAFSMADSMDAKAIFRQVRGYDLPECIQANTAIVNGQLVRYPKQGVCPTNKDLIYFDIILGNLWRLPISDKPYSLSVSQKWLDQEAVW